MFPTKLDNNKEYNFYHWQFFKNHLNVTTAFIEKNYIIKMHEQEFYEVNVIVKGNGMHYIKDNKIPAKVGDIFIIPPHVPHGYVGSKGFDVYHLLLSDDFFNKHYTDLQQLPSFHTLFNAEPLMRSSVDNPLHLSLNESQFKYANSILNEILKFQDNFNPYHCLNCTYLSMYLITYFCQVYSLNFNQSKNLSQDHAFMNTISYVHKHYHEKITLNTLVKMSNMSRSSYINKFKQICKMPPLTYLIKIRLDAAENLLLNTELPIMEIAFRTGFYDCAHFTKVFIAEKGMSPVQYKKAKKNKS